MTREIRVHPTPLLIAFVALILVGCAGNRPYRTAGLKECGAQCVDATIEQHKDRNEIYDLAFVEFTERGNVFDRDQMEMVLEHVRELANPKQQEPYEGVMVVVFVHGWKHNASPGDSNVDDFRDLLRKAARLDAGGRRKLVGIYVGWPGASITLPGIEQITYWERKSVAEQVAKGGVTELLTRLERILIDDKKPNRNLYLVVGHSFGGAIVLSALNEVLLERVVAAEHTGTCLRSRPFGHGVLLLNAAMEANEVFQLKEVVSRAPCFPEDQDSLMHVITSDADTATGWIFWLGQKLGMLRWEEAQLERSDNFAVHESVIDTTTVGHYLPFQTGQLCTRGSERAECQRNGRPDDCFRVSPDDELWYISYAGREDCVDADDNPNHIKVGEHEPLAFVQTDGGFIGDHNNVFTDKVAAYLSALLVEERLKRAPDEPMRVIRECHAKPGDPYDFVKCLYIPISNSTNR